MLKKIVDYFTYNLIGLEGRFGESVNFFIYDSIKIILLLLLMISIIGFIRTYISEKKIRDYLSKKNRYASHLAASLFGAFTPFCSCSSIPIFIGFLKARVPLGIALSFIITSPIINEYLAVLMFMFFGWKIALAYIISGLFIGVFSGIILGKMNLEKYIDESLLNAQSKINKETKFTFFKERINFGFNEALGIVKKIWIWILIGVGIGAVIHNYIPSETIQAFIGSGGIFSVPIAVFLGIPLYANCAAIVPVALVLFEKGISLGAVLSFMMAASALSFPEAVILRRAMKLRLIIIFFMVVGISIIFTGYLFNLLEAFLV